MKKKNKVYSCIEISSYEKLNLFNEMFDQDIKLVFILLTCLFSSLSVECVKKSNLATENFVKSINDRNWSHAFQTIKRRNAVIPDEIEKDVKAFLSKRKNLDATQVSCRAYEMGVSDEKSSQEERMSLKLYYTLLSPPSRAVLLFVKTLNIPFELINVNLAKAEHRSTDFQKKNPQHTVPTLEDGEFILWDSHAINSYIINKYVKNDDRYPTDPNIRAIIDQRLFFDTGVLFPCIKSVVGAIVRRKTETTITEALAFPFLEAYDFTEKFLNGSEFIAGNDITIADYSFVTSLTSMNTVVPIKKEKYPLLIGYLDRCKNNMQYYKEVNEEGIEHFKELFKSVNFKFPETEWK